MNITAACKIDGAPADFHQIRKCDRIVHLLAWTTFDVPKTRDFCLKTARNTPEGSGYDTNFGALERLQYTVVIILGTTRDIR